VLSVRFKTLLIAVQERRQPLRPAPLAPAAAPAIGSAAAKHHRHIERMGFRRSLLMPAGIAMRVGMVVSMAAVVPMRMRMLLLDRMGGMLLRVCEIVWMEQLVRVRIRTRIAVLVRVIMGVPIVVRVQKTLLLGRTCFELRQSRDRPIAASEGSTH
jgi:hypothetical protein